MFALSEKRILDHCRQNQWTRQADQDQEGFNSVFREVGTGVFPFARASARLEVDIAAALLVFYHKSASESGNG